MTVGPRIWPKMTIKWPQKGQTCLQPCESWLIFLADDSLIFSRYKIIRINNITGHVYTGVLESGFLAHPVS